MFYEEMVKTVQEIEREIDSRNELFSALIRVLEKKGITCNEEVFNELFFIKKMKRSRMNRG